MKYDLLLFDLDGTLLDVDRTIRPATLQVLQELMRRGVRVGLSTGRSVVSVRPFLTELRPTGPLILLNGCLLWDVERGAATASAVLPREDAVRLVELTIELGIHANVYIGDELFVHRRGRLSIQSEQKDGVPHTEVSDLIRFVRDHPQTPYKLLCIDETADFSNLQSRLESALQSDCTLVNSEPTYLEVLPPGVHKGAMLAEIERHYRIPPERVVAFGDELNDLELLRAAGHAVAMGNANPALAQIADVRIGPNDSDAIADYLRELFDL